MFDAWPCASALALVLFLVSAPNDAPKKYECSAERMPGCDGTMAYCFCDARDCWWACSPRYSWEEGNDE
jgi:hypothetical protein